MGKLYPCRNTCATPSGGDSPEWAGIPHKMEGIPTLFMGIVFRSTVLWFLLWLCKEVTMGWCHADRRRLRGRIVVITGGSGGVGRATAEAVAAAGAVVIILGRNKDKVTDRIAISRTNATDFRCRDLRLLHRSQRSLAIGTYSLCRWTWLA